MINDTNDDLNKSIEKLKIFTEQSLVGIMIIQDGLLKYFNKPVSKTSGYSIEEIKGWNPDDFLKIIHPEDREFVAEQARRRQLANPDVVDEYKYRIIRKNGEIAWIKISTKTINYEGHPAIFAITYNISEEVKSEQQLKESEEKFRNLTDNSVLGITILQDGILKYFNKKVTDTFGVSEEEIKNWGPEDSIKIIHPDDRDLVIREAIKVQRGEIGDIFNYKFRILRKDGKIGWRDIFAKSIIYEGRPAAFAIHVDITDKIEAEQKLKESEEKFSKAFNSNALAMSISTLEEGRIFEVNDAFLKLLGFSKKEIIGKTASEARLKGRRERKDMMRTVKEQGTVINHETDYRTKSGEVRYGLFSFVKILLNDKPFLLTIINDITPLKLAEQKLKQSKKKYLRAYNQVEFYKDLFIHDITNNLQILYSSIQLIDINLKENCKNDTIRDFIDIIYRQINRGTELVDNVRKLSQLEEHEISIEEVDVFEVLNRSIEFLRNSFQDKKIQIKWDLSSKKVLILGNDQLQDVFENILINSVRYNNNDIVEIIIKALQVEQDGISYWKLEFIDNGIGIEDERKRNVLTRADPTSKTTYGMGLGLSLVKKIVENYDGKVWIEDKVEGDYAKGTKVILLMLKGDH